MLERVFHLKELNTSVSREILAGVTTFLTMSYIIVVQPIILTSGESTMDFRSVTIATCISAAVATLIMGLFAKYPIAQAPGMGLNALFVSSLIPACMNIDPDRSWQLALGVIFISGTLFLVLSLLRVREYIFNALSSSVKNGIGVGIGLFIALIGLQQASVIVDNQFTLVSLTTQFTSPEVVVFLVGFFVAAICLARKVPGSILWGIVSGTLVAYSWKAISPETISEHLQFPTAIFSAPPSVAPTAFQLDILGALHWDLLPFILIFLMMDMFDTMGTLVAVSEQAGLMEDGKLPRAKKALLSDAIGTVVGALLGTSTVTSYIESASGVAQGGRSGLTAVTVAILFIIAIFFTPVLVAVGSYQAITASALVIVGSMMAANVRKIKWEDPSEALPAFIIMIGIPFSYSITDGIALGVILYPIIKFVAGKKSETTILMYVLSLVFLAYFVFLKS